MSNAKNFSLDVKKHGSLLCENAACSSRTTNQYLKRFINLIEKKISISQTQTCFSNKREETKVNMSNFLFEHIIYEKIMCRAGKLGSLLVIMYKYTLKSFKVN